MFSTRLPYSSVTAGRAGHAWTPARTGPPDARASDRRGDAVPCTRGGPQPRPTAIGAELAARTDASVRPPSADFVVDDPKQYPMRTESDMQRTAAWLTAGIAPSFILYIADCCRHRLDAAVLAPRPT